MTHPVRPSPESALPSTHTTLCTVPPPPHISTSPDPTAREHPPALRELPAQPESHCTRCATPSIPARRSPPLQPPSPQQSREPSAQSPPIPAHTHILKSALVRHESRPPRPTPLTPKSPRTFSSTP
ncbi:hypothetical protein CesoFtcFv8_003309 [Champsocephalus esox]|uniref:Uncharacterized protein n=1 Tax=Champsocephalus esox TaxID=159716 RepID=A0AAN8CTL3_9TELE|nr:hypothetical protein CesoFtcFv8_003309 [Champsocephalus esox]